MAASPLEELILEYVETVGGLWEAVEPQVYDVILPEGVAEKLELSASDGVARLTFDPEALADHRDAHLMTFGNPTLDQVFQQAQALGQLGKLYLSGYNLSPHDLPSTLERSLEVPEGVTIHLASARVHHFHAGLFWFETTFISDEKEQEIVTVGIERYYGRRVRHLAEALHNASLSEVASLPYPDAIKLSLKQAYILARDETLRRVTATAHARQAELQANLQREIQRMTTYFADLRTELTERQTRAEARDLDTKRYRQQRQALDREEQARLQELRQKMSLRVQVRLVNTLQVVQPKLRLAVELMPAKGQAGHVEVIWDPVTQNVEAVPCPRCGRPTLALAVLRGGEVVCSACTDGAEGIGH